MSKRLSILICSLSARFAQLQTLMKVLQPQITDEVEILVKTDEGQMSIGKKRNMLLDEASGDYVAFIDDDDMVSETYVKDILEAIKTNPDCCGLQGTITFQGRNPRRFIHSLRYKTWFEKDRIYYRCPNHLNTIKRELALSVRFPETNFGEDKDFSERLLPLLKTEVFIEKVLYYYMYEKSRLPMPKRSRHLRRINPR